MPYALFGYVLPERESIVRVNKKTGKIQPVINTDRAKLRGKILDAFVMICLVVFIFAALSVNVFIILLSTSQPGKEVTIRGVIPYIFKSNTMEPTIMENDLAYFNRVDSQEKINVGDIVLFQENKVVYVERVTAIENGTYSVDIDYYPPMSEVGAMKKNLDRSAIYGVYTHANRWLGALILFSNTIFGRLLFLLIPAFMLFFYQPIKSFFAKNFSRNEDG